VSSRAAIAPATIAIMTIMTTDQALEAFLADHADFNASAVAADGNQ